MIPSCFCSVPPKQSKQGYRGDSQTLCLSLIAMFSSKKREHTRLGVIDLSSDNFYIVLGGSLLSRVKSMLFDHVTSPSDDQFTR